LHNIDHGVWRDRIAQAVAIGYLVAVDESRHVLSQAALVVEDVPASALVRREIVLEYVSQRTSSDLARRARDVTLNIVCEADGGHVVEIQ
jgi:hypothetical protein